ncbi:MAG TPA: radical SAM protein [Thermoanaerobaculia bacterium]|nr:radical SAM protein [Thermoanaerobaculia bacterium]
MLRTSNYTIYVDLPGNSEEMLLVHGYTGAYDKVSRRVATYMRSLERRRPPKPLYGDWSPEAEVEGQVPLPSEGTLQVLKRRGYLTEMSPESEAEFFTAVTDRLHQRKILGMPSYIVMPTYNCNLRCSYCFQDHMRTDQRFGHLLRTMRPEMVDRIFAGLPKIEALHGIEGDGPRARRIGFFGGEPLLEASRPTVQYIMDKALALGTAAFWAVTNGTELHAYEALLSPEKLSQLQITIDGPPQEHDRRRIYADGSGSYERIARNISMALDHGVYVSIRLNVDRNNVQTLPELAEEFVARGWDSQPRFSVYTAPIRAENENTDAKSTFNTWELDQAVAVLHEQHAQMTVIGRPDSSIKQQARQIFGASGASMPTFRESFCSAHTRMYIFDAFADIYACWDRTGDPTVRIGRLDEDGSVTLNTTVNHLWRSRTVASNPVCRNCRYALHCGGGCAVLALGKTGEYHSNFCDGFASRFRSSVAEAYLEHVRGEELTVTSGRVCDQ